MGWAYLLHNVYSSLLVTPRGGGLNCHPSRTSAQSAGQTQMERRRGREREERKHVSAKAQAVMRQELKRTFCCETEMVGRGNSPSSISSGISVTILLFTACHSNKIHDSNSYFRKRSQKHPRTKEILNHNIVRP